MNQGDCHLHDLSMQHFTVDSSDNEIPSTYPVSLFDLANHASPARKNLTNEGGINKNLLFVFVFVNMSLRLKKKAPTNDVNGLPPYDLERDFEEVDKGRATEIVVRNKGLTKYVYFY